VNKLPIGLVTDSTADIPSSLCQQYDIRMAPISIQFGQDTYEENVTIDRATFLRWLDEKPIPTSSQPAPGRFVQIFQDLLQAGYEQILCVTITSKHSGTYQSAVLASSMVPQAKIAVWDSLAISMGTGYQVLAAARMAEQGLGSEAILEHLVEIRAGMQTYLSPSTLRYLQKSGRVGTLSGALASLLEIKPILYVNNGLLDTKEKIRTRGKALERMGNLVAQDLATAKSVRLAVAHAQVPEEAQQLRQRLEGMLPCVEFHTVELASSLTVHGGPGVIGVMGYGEG